MLPLNTCLVSYKFSTSHFLIVHERWRDFWTDVHFLIICVHCTAVVSGSLIARSSRSSTWVPWVLTKTTRSGTCIPREFKMQFVHFNYAFASSLCVETHSFHISCHKSAVVRSSFYDIHLYIFQVTVHVIFVFHFTLEGSLLCTMGVSEQNVILSFLNQKHVEQRIWIFKHSNVNIYILSD